MDRGSWHCIGASDQNHPKKKKWKKAKFLSEEALQIVEKGKETKSKGEKERYTHLTADFQRIARKDKKGFLSEQCKEIEGNNWMGKTRGLFKQIRDIKEIFYAITIKDRNSKDWTEAEDIKNRWQVYTEELYKRYLNDPDNHDGVITYLEPDTLECEVKWAIGSITTNKPSGGDGIPAELFQILNDDVVKLPHLHSNPKKGNVKKCSNYHTIVLISHDSKVMVKILQARLQQYMNWEIPDVHAGFR